MKKLKKLKMKKVPPLLLHSPPHPGYVYVTLFTIMTTYTSSDHPITLIFGI